MKLREYQDKYINDVRGAFRSSRSVLAVLPCGAGKTVCFAYMASKHIEKSDKNRVWFLVHRNELIEQTIQAFKDMGLSMRHIFVGMVQTISRHPERYEKPTLIIFDEAHHATAKTWTNIIDFFLDVPIVGLTATPSRLDGSPLGSIFEKLVIGISPKELMNLGYLCQYDYYAPRIYNEEFRIKGSDYDQQEVSDFFIRSRIYGDVLKYIDPKRKTIIYCPSIKFSKFLSEQIPGVVHFDGDTPDKERARIVKDFKEGKIRILSNVDLIGEGFDVPDCDCVILLRPTRSTALYIQQSMRCLRPGENKKAIIYDLVGNVFRHGLPTEDRKWSLEEKIRCKNESAEDEVLVRECKNCFRVYSGLNPVCPYCGFDNGKTRKQLDEEKEIELQKVTEIERNNKRKEQGRAESIASLIEIAKKRGYKNPAYWATQVYNGRARKIKDV